MVSRPITVVAGVFTSFIVIYTMMWFVSFPARSIVVEQILITDAHFDRPKVGNLTIDIRNTGTSEVTIVSVAVRGGGEDAVISTSSIVSGGASATITVSPDMNFSVDTQYEITIKTSRGARVTYVKAHQ